MLITRECDYAVRVLRAMAGEKRVSVNEICEKEEYRESDILVSTHGAALAALLANIRGVGLKDYWGSGVHKNCAVTAVDVTEHGYKIVFENKVYYDDKVEDWNM